MPCAHNGRCFRFGPELAFVANAILQALKTRVPGWGGPRDLPLLVGNGDVDGRVYCRWVHDCTRKPNQQASGGRMSMSMNAPA